MSWLAGVVSFYSHGADITWPGTVTNVAAGNETSMIAIDTDGNGKGDKVYTWGYNNYGQLGVGNKTTYTQAVTPVISVSGELTISGISLDSNSIKFDSFKVSLNV